MPARHKQAWLVWGIAAGFYAYGFFQRVAPSVIVDDLMLAFALDATLLGTLSAAYFYTYAVLQVPIGVLIDRHGAKAVLVAGALAAAAGGILFALAGGLATALVARALIGAGVAVSYISTLKLAGAWFPPERFGLLAGLTLAAGTAGAVGAQVPLALAVDRFGWRPTLLAIGLVGLVITGLVVAIVRDTPAPRGARPATRSLDMAAAPGLLDILKRSETWCLIVIAGLIGAPILTFAGLWGVPYFVQVHGLDRTAAALLTSLMLIAWAIGGPTVGALADRVRSRARLILAIGAMNGLLWLPFILWPALPLALALPLVVVIGMGGGGMIAAFAITREVFGVAAAGRALGIVNTSVLLLGAAMQMLFGIILDRLWNGAMTDGYRLYDAPAYATGFIIFFLAGAAVTAAALGLRENRKNCSSNR